MSSNKNNSSKEQVSNGYTAKYIPHGMILIGVSDDGTKIYSASRDIMKKYYPDLYKLKPNGIDYIFIGNNGMYTPIGASNDTYDKFIDRSLLRVNTLDTKLNNTLQNVKQLDTELSTYGNGTAYSAYDPEHPVTKSNIERYIYWDPVNKHARWVQNKKEIRKQNVLE